MNLVMGLASSGERVAIPRKHNPAPMPTTAAPDFPVTAVSPYTRRSAPIPLRAHPAMPRIRRERVGRTKVSRIAATGGTDAALRAGMKAATAVTTIPTA